MFSIKSDLPFSTEKKPIQKIRAARHSKIKYMSGQLCKMINKKQIIIEKKGENTSIPICTPFSLDIEDTVTIIKDKNDVYLTVCKFGSIKSTKYTELAKHLEPGIEAYKKDQLQTIYDYLKMPSNDQIKDIETFNDLVIKQYRYKDLENLKAEDNSLREVLSCLSAILMIAEPYRYEDQGRQSRALIRRMYSNFKKSKGEITKSKMTKSGAESEINNMVLDPKNNESDEYFDNDNEYMSDDENGLEKKKINPPRKKRNKKKKITKTQNILLEDDESTSSMSNVFEHGESSESNDDKINMFEDEKSDFVENKEEFSTFKKKEMKEEKEVSPFKYDFDDEDDTSSDEFKEKEIKEEKEVSSSESGLGDEEDTELNDDNLEDEIKSYKETYMSEVSSHSSSSESESSSHSSSSESESSSHSSSSESKDSFRDSSEETKYMSEESLNSSSSSSSSESKDSSESDSPKKKPKRAKQKTTKKKKKAKYSSESDLDDDVTPKSLSKKKKAKKKKTTKK